MTIHNSSPRPSVEKILLAIINKGLVSQTDLPKLTNLSRLTISKELKNLEQKRYIKFDRGPLKIGLGRRSNHWRINFRGILLVFSFLNRDLVKIDNFTKRYKDDWIIFREWDYIKKNPEVRMYIENNISEYISKEMISLEYLSWDPNIPNDFWLNLPLKTRERFHIERDEYEKHLLLRSILGLHRVFYCDFVLGGYYEASNIIPYLIKSPVFKILYERELELLKRNYAQLMMVSEIIKDPGTADQVSFKLRKSKILEFKDSYDQYLNELP